ncbi:integrase catalytic domain-containing protein [Trichonephila clavipes]|nr:integrase catalytic domain-containing protein [Trichonephila clavipes]
MSVIHGLAHPGIKFTVKLMTEKYVWSDVKKFGVPAKLVTDQSRQFEAELFRSIAAICGAKVAPHIILPPSMDPQNFVAKLQQHMAELKPLKSPSNRKQNIFVHKDLKSCSHVFIRIDRVKKALKPPYEGSYAVQKSMINISQS